MTEALFKGMLVDHFDSFSPLSLGSCPLSGEAHKSWSKLNEIASKLPELKPVMDEHIQLVCGVKGWTESEIEPNSSFTTTINKSKRSNVLITDSCESSDHLRTFLTGVGVYKIVFEDRISKAVKSITCIKRINKENTMLSAWEQFHELYVVTDVESNEDDQIPVEGVISVVRIDA